MTKLNVGARRTFIAAVAGFVIGGLTVMVLARESSSVYLKNSLALVPAYLASATSSRIADGDLVGAERLLASQSGINWYYLQHPTASAKWNLAYPLSAWLVDRATAGMASTPAAIDREWARSNGMLDAQLALVLEMQGRHDRARELMKLAIAETGSSEEQLREVARELLGM